MRRVALLGATGSIGRQAMEVVSAHPDLALCALQSGSTPLDDLAADHDVEHVQIGGDSVALLERSEPDIVLNAVVGFAGVEATLWALERGSRSRSQTRRASSPPESSRSPPRRGVGGSYCPSTASTPRSTSASRVVRPRPSPESS